jgi:hypothetical protein
MADSNDARHKCLTQLMTMADEHRVHMAGLSFEEALTFKKSIFDQNDVVFGFHFESNGVGRVVGQRRLRLFEQ